MDGFHQLTLFDPDETASLYLERELGITEANRRDARARYPSGAGARDGSVPRRRKR
jgi:hypothetical protein